ncbi:MAG: efflux RND transporter permease subunit [Spirochaetaceae bacterium]|nr:efflux RND transporter permease subunit [Spirochaetaceae bacterium]
MTSFAEFSVRRPLGVILVIAAICLFGFFAIGQLPLLFLPEIESPGLSVVAPFPNSSPEEVERRVASPLEGAIAGMSGIESVNSTSSASSARVRAQFVVGTDMDLAAAEIRDRIDRIRGNLPDGVGRIRVSNFSTSDIPILQLSVSMDGSRAELERLTEDLIVPRLLRLEGVADVQVRGLQEEQVMIDLDPEAMASLGVTVDELTRSLRVNNVDLAGGYLIDGGRRYFVRSVGSFTDLEEIASLPIAGAGVRIGDVGVVRRGVGDQDSVQRLNLAEAVTVRVFKGSDANVVSVVRAARGQLAEIEAAEPRLAAFVFFDQSEEITTSLNNLRNSGLIGAGLAVLVLFAFLLRVRATLVVAIAIPISIIATFTVVYLMRRVGGLNFSLNVISLSGLMLAVGMLVDNSVVVLENIYRYRERGLAPRAAAIRGAGEVTTPVVAATVTSIIVFVPVLFNSTSTFGRFMGDFATTLVAAMIASLVISLSLIPVVSSRFLVAGGGGRHRFMDAIAAVYRSVLRWTLHHRLITVAGMLVVLAGGIYLLTKIEREFTPPTPARRMSIAVTAENGVTFDETREVFDAFERDLLARTEELEIDAVSANFSARSGNVTVYFRDDASTERSTAELTNEIRAMMPQLPGYSFSVGRRWGRGGGGALGVSVDITGPNTDVLALFAEDIGARLGALPGVNDVSTNLESGDEQLQVRVNRDRATAANLTPTAVGQLLSSNLSESNAGSLAAGDDELPIRVRVTEAARVDLSGLAQLPVDQAADAVPLGALATFERQPGPRSIQRDGGSEIVSVTANTDMRGMFRLRGQIQGMLAQQQLPPGYTAEVGQNFRRFQQSEQQSMFALILAAAFIYLVMAALFESFVHPITILTSLPFSLLGVAVLFSLTDTTLNTNSWLGIMVLAGVVVNNGIILIDHINRLRAGGMARTEAILTGGRDRLRPILITACTTILGLFPLVAPLVAPGVFGPVEGRAGIWGPIGLAVVGGLTTSTFMTLVVMPTIYALLDDLAEYLRRVVRAMRPARRLPAQPTPEAER